MFQISFDEFVIASFKMRRIFCYSIIGNTFSGSLFEGFSKSEKLLP